MTVIAHDQAPGRAAYRATTRPVGRAVRLWSPNLAPCDEGQFGWPWVSPPPRYWGRTALSAGRARGLPLFRPPPTCGPRFRSTPTADDRRSHDPEADTQESDTQEADTQRSHKPAVLKVPA